MADLVEQMDSAAFFNIGDFPEIAQIPVFGSRFEFVRVVDRIVDGNRNFVGEILLFSETLNFHAKNSRCSRGLYSVCADFSRCSGLDWINISPGKAFSGSGKQNIFPLSVIY